MNLRRTMTWNALARQSLRALALPAALAILPVSTAASEASSCRQLEQRLAQVTRAPRQQGSELDRVAGRPGAAGLASADMRRERVLPTSALQVKGCVGDPAGRAPSAERAAGIGRAGPPILAMDGSIPVPLPLPASSAEIDAAGYVEFGRSRLAAADLARREELARPRTMSPARRDIRIVGGRFLALPDENMDFIAVSTGSESPANQILGGLLAVIEGALVSSAVAAER